MAVQLNHTIAHATDPLASATFLAEVLGMGPPTVFEPFQVVELDNHASIDFIAAGDYRIEPLHYAFLVSEEEFDQIFGRIRDRGLDYWADPHKQQPGEINTHQGGRGVYWDAPDGHLLEILTVPYGGWPTPASG
jgi:catechol 2,3-dioxygenase-like lactoylglutathione lyase family enzyme